MAILSGPEVKRVIHCTRMAAASGHPIPLPTINIVPLPPDDRFGANSVDLRLGNRLLTYVLAPGEVLDPRKANPTKEHIIPEEGLDLFPGELYLGSTIEQVSCAGLVPCIETRSSWARLGMSVHLSAGWGDDGDEDLSWTLEITVVKPLKVFAGMWVCQVAFDTLHGARKPYDKGKYNRASGPVASRSWQDALPPSTDLPGLVGGAGTVAADTLCPPSPEGDARAQ